MQNIIRKSSGEVTTSDHIHRFGDNVKICEGESVNLS
jgi:hypothetical protein